ADRNRSHWSTSKTPSYTKSVSWQHHPFTGTVSSANSGNYYTIFNTDTGAAFNNVSLAIGDSLGTSYKSGMGIDQKIVKDTSTNKGKAKQTLNFKAWLVGAADAPDLGNFEANTTFQITYL
ncbi:hypothetical protein ACFH5U_16075, partial [Escherichia coli]